MHHTNFRKNILDNLPIHEKRYYISDEKVHGLCLAIYPSGSKTYVLYRRIKGTPQRIKIGSYTDLTIEAARKEATRLNAKIALGTDPLEERKAKKQELTFHNLYTLYYSQHAKKFVKNADEDKKMLERHFLNRLGKLGLGDITADKVRKLHIDIGEKYPAAANKVIALVSAVVNFGKKYGYFEQANPCSGVKKFRTVSRDRFLTNLELDAFFDALKHEEERYQDYFSLLLFTGVRKSNLLSMRWADVDLNLKQWRISADMTKNKEINIVYLPSNVLDILKRREEKNEKLKEPSKYIFPGTGKQGHFQDPKKSFNRIRKRMGVQDFTIHDLRRTLGSYMAISGASLPIIGKALNHKSQESTKIYARLSNDPVYNAVERAVTLMSGNNVVTLYNINVDIICKKIEVNTWVKFNEIAS